MMSSDIHIKRPSAIGVGGAERPASAVSAEKTQTSQSKSNSVHKQSETDMLPVQHQLHIQSTTAAAAPFPVSASASGSTASTTDPQQQQQQQQQQIQEYSLSPTSQPQHYHPPPPPPDVPVIIVPLPPPTTDHPVACLWTGCTDTFVTEDACFAHLLEVHAQNGKQSCKWHPHEGRPVCGQALRNRGNFADHVVTHFSKALRPIECPLCGQHLRNRQDVKRHEQKHLPQDGAAVTTTQSVSSTKAKPRKRKSCDDSASSSPTQTSQTSSCGAHTRVLPPPPHTPASSAPIYSQLQGPVYNSYPIQHQQAWRPWENTWSGLPGPGPAGLSPVENGILYAQGYPPSFYHSLPPTATFSHYQQPMYYNDQQQYMIPINTPPPSAVDRPAHPGAVQDASLGAEGGLEQSQREFSDHNVRHATSAARLIMDTMGGDHPASQDLGAYISDPSDAGVFSTPQTQRRRIEQQREEISQQSALVRTVGNRFISPLGGFSDVQVGIRASVFKSFLKAYTNMTCRALPSHYALLIERMDITYIPSHICHQAMLEIVHPNVPAIDKRMLVDKAVEGVGTTQEYSYLVYRCLGAWVFWKSRQREAEDSRFSLKVRKNEVGVRGAADPKNGGGVIETTTTATTTTTTTATAKDACTSGQDPTDADGATTGDATGAAAAAAGGGGGGETVSMKPLGREALSPSSARQLFTQTADLIVTAILHLCNNSDPYTSCPFDDGFGVMIRMKPLLPSLETITTERVLQIVRMRRAMQKSFVESVKRDLKWLGAIRRWMVRIEWRSPERDWERWVGIERPEEEVDGVVRSVYWVGMVRVRFVEVDEKDDVNQQHGGNDNARSTSPPGCDDGVIRRDPQVLALPHGAVVRTHAVYPPLSADAEKLFSEMFGNNTSGSGTTMESGENEGVMRVGGKAVTCMDISGVDPVGPPSTTSSSDNDDNDGETPRHGVGNGGAGGGMVAKRSPRWTAMGQTQHHQQTHHQQPIQPHHLQHQLHQNHHHLQQLHQQYRQQHQQHQQQHQQQQHTHDPEYQAFLRHLSVSTTTANAFSYSDFSCTAAATRHTTTTSTTTGVGGGSTVGVGVLGPIVPSTSPSTVVQGWQPGTWTTIDWSV
ncbi:hypothetical protein BC832DRAFT_300867 [Gaertneriomyces semiglobifer]|nr:hypothetical protein BC832DRAFT_300867 [Gaertneriomyces semiglobifer]